MDRGEGYIGIDLDCNYEKFEVKLSMKVYVLKFLKEFQHSPPPKPVNGPTPYTAPIYFKSVQYAPIEEEKTLTYNQIRHVQEVCRKLLYPARTVDNKMIHSLSEMCIAATKVTQETARLLTHLLNYFAMVPWVATTVTSKTHRYLP